MPIDETIAGYSDLAFESAFAVYVVAFVLLIWQFASAKAGQGADASELVAARWRRGGGGAAGAGWSRRRASRSRSGWATRRTRC